MWARLVSHTERGAAGEHTIAMGLSTTWHDMVWHGLQRTAGHGAALVGKARCGPWGTACHDVTLAWHGMAWHGMACWPQGA